MPTFRPTVRHTNPARAARRVVAAEVARINAAFGEGEGEGVVYEERAEPMRMEERLALWVAADVMVHAPARDAYSLTPLEFVHAQGVKVAAGGPRDVESDVLGRHVVAHGGMGALVLDGTQWQRVVAMILLVGAGFSAYALLALGFKATSLTELKAGFRR